MKSQAPRAAGADLHRSEVAIGRRRRPQLPGIGFTSVDLDAHSVSGLRVGRARHVLEAAVDRKRDDDRLGAELFGHASTADHVRPTRDAREDPLFLGESSGHLDRLLVLDDRYLVHARAIEVRRHQPGPALHRERPSLGPAGDRRRGGGLEPDDADRLVVRLECLRHAHQRAGGADAVAKGGDAPRRLLPDLLTERVPEAGDDVRVVELVRRVGAGLTGKFCRTFDHVFDVLRRDAPRPFDGGNDLELRTEGAHELQPLLAEAVGNHDPHGVALRTADKSERRPGAAAGVLDDRRSRLEECVALGDFDHRERQPILHRARGIQILELHPKLGAVWRRERLQANERCVPNGREDACLGHRFDPNDGILRGMSPLRLTFRRWLIRGLSKVHLAVQRLSRGRLLSKLAGMPVLLLTTTGRRSGRARTTPLTFFRDGRDLVVIASNGGADRAPDWSVNLQQDPHAVVQIGTDKLSVEARSATPEERERLWVGITATYPGYAAYQRKTTRRIPVLILTPRE